MEKKRNAKKKKRSMESCLTLVRSFYSGENDMVSGFIADHPTMDKNRLLSKILSQKMIKCTQAINEDQVTFLQQYKQNPVDVNYRRTDFLELISLDWDELKY